MDDITGSEVWMEALEQTAFEERRFSPKFDRKQMFGIISDDPFSDGHLIEVLKASVS